MLTFRRPILAASLLPPSVEHTDENILAAMQKLRYPVLASLKKDGIRALRLNGSLLSRTLKPIPNKSIRERSLIMPGGFDMELWSPLLRYDEIESIVMSREHLRSSEIQFHVLDWFGSAESYVQRVLKIYGYLDDNRDTIEFNYPMEFIYPVDLLQWLLYCERMSGEGICFRLPNSPYKQGRSTLKEQYLVKLARYTYEEAIIVGFVEQLENGNNSSVNSLGLSERSSCADGMCGKNTLGALICHDIKCNELRIGTGVGLTNQLRKKIWMNKKEYLGRQITFKYKGHGTKDLPRCPIFVGFRNTKEI